MHWTLRPFGSGRAECPGFPLRLAGAIVLSILFAGSIAGCRSSKSSGKSGSSSQLTEPDLREKLAAFYVRFVNKVEFATENAASKIEDLHVRVRLLGGRERVVRSCRQAIFQRHPTAAFVDTWSLCISLDVHLQTPEAVKVFGEAQPPMLEAARTLRENIEDLGKLFLKPDDLAAAKETLEAFAQAHPFSMQGDIVYPSGDQKMNMPQLNRVLSLPLSPFRALEGVDHTAEAANEMTFVAHDIGQTIGDLPREMAWNLELLLLQSRRELSATFDDLDRRQTNLQATLQQVRLALADLNSVAARLDSTFASAERTANAVGGAGGSVNEALKTYTQMVKDLYPSKPEPVVTEQKPASRPFDILDYARTAEEISGTATNLQNLLVEFQKTVETNALTQRIKEAQSSAVETLSDAQHSARSLTNHIALLAALIIFCFFTTLFVYRAATVSLQKRRLTQPPQS